jgi:hypothetical protein
MSLRGEKGLFMGEFVTNCADFSKELISGACCEDG